jgi:hypothetical protein
MTSTGIVVDAFERIREIVHDVVRGLNHEELEFRVDGGNSIAWLVWHLTRIQDDHIADAAGTEQMWTAKGWVERFAFPFDPSATGFGHSSDQVAMVRVNSGDLLVRYHDEVCDATVGYVRRLTDSDMERIVDESWDPPVSLAVRLVSVIADNLQHAGQAAYIRGVLRRRSAAGNG